jgi:hypothetical protein
MALLMLIGPTMARSQMGFLDEASGQAAKELLGRCNFNCMGEALGDAACSVTDCSAAHQIREQEEHLRQERNERREQIELAKEKYEECRSTQDGLREGVEKCQDLIPKEFCSTSPDGSWGAC